MTSGLILREYRSGDLEDIAVLEKRAFTVGPYSRSMLRRLFGTRESFSFVAEEEGRIIGYVSALPLDEFTADVESIAVDPGWQGRGIGGILLEKIEEEMLSRGFTRSILEVRDRNDPTIEFYKKRGYMTVQHMQTYYREYFKGSRGAFRMVKVLKS